MQGILFVCGLNATWPPAVPVWCDAGVRGQKASLLQLLLLLLTARWPVLRLLLLLHMKQQQQARLNLVSSSSNMSSRAAAQTTKQQLNSKGINPCQQLSSSSKGPPSPLPCHPLPPLQLLLDQPQQQQLVRLRLMLSGQ